MELIRSYRSTDVGLPQITVGSAPALTVSRPAQRSLTLQPADSPSRLMRPSTPEAPTALLPPPPLRLLPGGAIQFPGEFISRCGPVPFTAHCNRVVYDSYLSFPSQRFGPAPSLQWDHGRSRVLPLQAVGRRRGGARLLDHDRNGPNAGSLGRSPGRLGAAARDCRLFRRSADLRLAQIGDVLAQVVLLLRASEEELPGNLR